LQGGTGADELRAGTGQNILDGGADDDSAIPLVGL
jgi:hemolysin type calcium-binding protein